MWGGGSKDDRRRTTSAQKGFFLINPAVGGIHAFGMGQNNGKKGEVPEFIDSGSELAGERTSKSVWGWQKRGDEHDKKRNEWGRDGQKKKKNHFGAEESTVCETHKTEAKFSQTNGRTDGGQEPVSISKRQNETKIGSGQKTPEPTKSRRVQEER